MTKQQHRAFAQHMESAPLATGRYPVFLCGEWRDMTDGELALYHYLLAYAPDGVREEG